MRRSTAILESINCVWIYALNLFILHYWYLTLETNKTMNQKIPCEQLLYLLYKFLFTFHSMHNIITMKNKLDQKPFEKGFMLHFDPYFKELRARLKVKTPILSN